MTEHDMQASIIAECNWRANQDARWGLLMAIPNGQYREGQRMEPGLRAGVPDLFLPVARHSRIGLWLELKVGKNRLSPEQECWIRRLRVEGYCVEVVYDDPQKAIDIITWYLEG